MAKHSDADVTARLNSVYADSPSGIDAGLRRAQARSVAEDWYLGDRAGQVSRRLMGQVESGLRLVLGL